MKIQPASFFAVLFFVALLLVGLPALGAGPGGASCGRCDIPYPNEYYYLTGGPYSTASEASTICSENLSDLPLGLDYSGYVIKWLGGAPPAEGASKSFSCAACVNNHISNPGEDWCTNSGSSDVWCNGASQPPFTIQQAIWSALDAYPGEVSAVDYFIADSELEGLGASYEVTVVKPRQGRSAVLRIDPFTGQVEIVQEATTAHQ